MIGELIPTGVTFGVGRVSLNTQFSGTADFNHVEVSGNLSAGTGGVIYSGGTDLYDIFSTGSIVNLWLSGSGTNAIIQDGGSNIASGNLSVAEGSLTNASGISAHAEGSLTTAIGQASHTEGGNTTADGNFSHAEGSGSYSFGDFSHAEGYQGVSLGPSSHAEGYSTTSSGDSSHSEGFLTTAIGAYSHAGGSGSISVGTQSFVHGLNSIASGASTVVFGNNITGATANTVYVPNLNIDSTPSNDNALTQILVRATDGTVKYRDSSSISGGGVSINPYLNLGTTGSTITWNVSGASTNYEITLSAATTLNLTNVRNGEYGTIIINQDAVGGRTISLGAVNGGGAIHRIVNGGGGSIVLTSTANAIDILTFTYNGSVMYWTVGNDYT